MCPEEELLDLYGNTMGLEGEELEEAIREYHANQDAELDQEGGPKCRGVRHVLSICPLCVQGQLRAVGGCCTDQTITGCYRRRSDCRHPRFRPHGHPILQRGP